MQDQGQLRKLTPEEHQRVKDESAREVARRTVFREVNEMWESRLLCSIKYTGWLDGPGKLKIFV